MLAEPQTQTSSSYLLCNGMLHCDHGLDAANMFLNYRMKIGYARVSTDEQSDSAQLDALQEAGCERIYQEKGSGKSRPRPELERMTDSLRAGDVVVVQRLDRLGRSLKDLIELLDPTDLLDRIGQIDLVDLADLARSSGLSN